MAVGKYMECLCVRAVARERQSRCIAKKPGRTVSAQGKYRLQWLLHSVGLTADERHCCRKKSGEPDRSIHGQYGGVGVFGNDDCGHPFGVLQLYEPLYCPVVPAVEGGWDQKDNRRGERKSPRPVHDRVG